MIKVICGGCGTTLNAPEEYLGRKGRCTKCGQSLVIAATTTQLQQTAISSNPNLTVAFPPEMEAGVREELPPDEILRAYCDMRAILQNKGAGVAAVGDVEFVAAVAAVSLLASTAVDQRGVTVALTNKTLAFLPRKSSFWGKRKIAGIGECKRIPLDMVSGIVTEKSKKRNLWHVTFKDKALNITLGGLKNSEESAVRFMRDVELVLSVESVSLADEFEKLAQLAKDGVLSEDEFKKAKQAYLGKSPDARDLAVSNLRQLHALCKSGVLTEGEFRLKKWEILSR